MSIFQSLPPVPTEAPWWVLALIIPASVWFSTQVWPWIMKRLDANASQREKDEEEAHQREEARDERRVRAQEQMAEALGQIRRFMEIMDWRWSSIESYMDPERKGRKVYPPADRERGGAE